MICKNRLCVGRLLFCDILSSFIPGYYLSTLIYFPKERAIVAKTILSITNHLSDIVLTVGRDGPKSVIREVIFQGTSLVYFFSSESTMTAG